jgi:hypothetical protein
MSVEQLPAATGSSNKDLTYDRTVPRGLVHRWSLSEVFLTDYGKTDDGTFACAAQLPSSHAYFRDHVGLPGQHDPLNVLEAGRQAVTYAAHVHQEVPRETTFMVSAWSLRISDPEPLLAGELPGELSIAGAVTDRRIRGGRVRRLAFAMDLALNGRALGGLTMDVSCTPTEQYHTLRRLQRGTEAPTAFSLPVTQAGRPVPPAKVGRLNPANVVLDDAEYADGEVSALLSPRMLGNRSMYDHPYDHVPAMVLSEAARQCALLLAAGPVGARRRLLQLDGQFMKFAELDSAVSLTARPTAGTEGVRMTAVQSGATVTEVDVVLG